MNSSGQWDEIAALVRRAQQGDETAFADLLESHNQVISTTLWACGVLSRDTAFDIAQDVALRAWQRLDSLRDPKAFRPWLRRIAGNAARDHLRRVAARREAVLDEALALESEDDPHDRAERVVELRMMMAALGEEEGEVVELLVARAEGTPLKDLASRMELPVAALKMRLSRARQRLRRRLDRLRGEPL